MSLAKVASQGRKEMFFPLFMDTPFARIDGANRDQLIKEIPKMTGQWVLLLTDTEFTTAEQNIFVEEKTVGKVYQLNKDEGVTKVELLPDVSLLQLRGENNG